jgi:excisionase family DNA binding protein
MSTEIPTLNKRGRAHRYSEVAKMFDVSERTIIREVRSGRLKADRLGARIVRIFDDSIAQYLERVRGKCVIAPDSMKADAPSCCTAHVCFWG